MTHAGPDDYVLCASWVLGPLFVGEGVFHVTTAALGRFHGTTEPTVAVQLLASEVARHTTCTVNAIRHSLSNVSYSWFY